MQNLTAQNNFSSKTKYIYAWHKMISPLTFYLNAQTSLDIHDKQMITYIL